VPALLPTSATGVVVYLVYSIFDSAVSTSLTASLQLPHELWYPTVAQQVRTYLRDSEKERTSAVAVRVHNWQTLYHLELDSWSGSPRRSQSYSVAYDTQRLYARLSRYTTISRCSQ